MHAIRYAATAHSIYGVKQTHNISIVKRSNTVGRQMTFLCRRLSFVEQTEAKSNQQKITENKTYTERTAKKRERTKQTKGKEVDNWKSE